MQFNTQEDRIAAIKKACDELGKIYGDMKFQEHMLVEFKQSFVPNTTVTVTTSAAPVVVEAPAAPVKAKATKPKAEPVVEAPAPVAPVVEAKVEAPAPVVQAKVEAPAPVVQAKVEAPAPASTCPIKTASELREVMLKRFNESGRTAEVQAALKAAIFETTGSEKVLDVKPELIAAAYNAIMAVAI